MILVTGATGLIGSHLLFKLCEEETSVKALYRTAEKCDKVKHVFSYYSQDYVTLFNKIEWIQGDITDIPSLQLALEDVTIVYHCAALVSFDPNDYRSLRKINIEGTANVVNLCLTNNIKKLCYVSSIAAIGEAKENEAANEETPWNQDADHNVYAITKYGAEMEVWRGIQEGLKTTIVNPGMVVGPGFWRQSSSSLFKKVYKGVSHYTQGVTGFVSVFDVVKAMISLTKSDVSGQRFIMVAEHLSFKEFFKKTANALGVKPPKKEASSGLLQVVWRLDWLRYFFKRNRRKLTRHTVRSITSKSYYENEKLKQVLDFDYTPINQSIKETASLFLKDQA